MLLIDLRDIHNKDREQREREGTEYSDDEVIPRSVRIEGFFFSLGNPEEEKYASKSQKNPSPREDAQYMS